MCFAVLVVAVVSDVIHFNVTVTHSDKAVFRGQRCLKFGFLKIDDDDVVACRLWCCPFFNS